MTKSLGGYIKELREQRDVTLRTLETMTGLTSGYLSLLEHDKVKQPKPAVLYKLAVALGASYPELMALAGHMPERGAVAEVDGKPFVAFKGAEKLDDTQRREVQEFIYFKLRQRNRKRGQDDDS